MTTICDPQAWTGFQCGVAVGFLLGVLFILLLAVIHHTGKTK